ncbi:MAG: 3-isopropylmalate dehydrogenase [Anaerolineales bacterium]|jgi:3-isopropylmalate dehydrogenase
MKAKIVLLPGDGIGTEVVGVGKSILEAVGETFDHDFEMAEHAIGGYAIDNFNNPLPDETLDACKSADAVLLGAVGGPKWDDPKATIRPEQGLLGLRKGMDLFANLRPIQPNPNLISASPLRTELLAGVDFVVVRELTGGIYFGEPKGREEVDGKAQAVDTMAYSEDEIQRIAQLAFSLAHQRKNKVTSVDKANVLACSGLWREIVTGIATEYPEVTLEHLLVDAAAMHLLTRPSSFDVILTANMFGDILTDEGSVLTGSLGNLPSASLGEDKNALGHPRGVYEPIHGSAPDIAGKGVANPIGTILSAAMLLRHSLGMENEAKVIEDAVDATLEAGFRTRDLAKSGEDAVSTEEMTKAILACLHKEMEQVESIR